MNPTIPLNEEHIEARQEETNSKLREFIETLPPHKKIAMDKLLDAVGSCKENDVPIICFAKFSEGFHQWNSFKDENNHNTPGTIEYARASWDTMRKFVDAAVSFIAPGFLVRIKLISRTSGHLLLDTHPKEE